MRIEFYGVAMITLTPYTATITSDDGGDLDSANPSGESLANSPPGIAPTILNDDLETADFLKTNSDGFEWTDRSAVSIVRDDQFVVNNGSPIMTGPIADREWDAISGQHSMRFRYGAGVEQSEQRFDLGAPQRDLWMRMSLKVPINFQHGTDSPTNCKLFALWMDGYSAAGDGPTVACEFWNDGSDGSELAVHFSQGGYTIMGGHLQLTPFISYPADQGRWMDFVVHVKAATNDSSNDGVIQTWRRWQGDAGWTAFHEVLDANIAAPSGGPNGFEAGYLMGWSNPAYDLDTEWLLDNFMLSESSLL